jgi:hypothetical protein
VKSENNGGNDEAYRNFARQLNNLLSDFDAIVTSACPSTKETAFVLVGAEPEDFMCEAERRSVTGRGGRVIPMISLDVSH